MPNFNGDITIDSMVPLSDTGVPTGASSFDPVDSTVDQLVSGTSTLFNATIYLSIYGADNLPRVEIRLEVVGDPPPVPVPTNTTVPLYSDEDISTGMGAWSVKVPKGRLSKGTKYVMIAKDTDNLVSVSQDIVTA